MPARNAGPPARATMSRTWRCQLSSSSSPRLLKRWIELFFVSMRMTAAEHPAHLVDVEIENAGVLLDV